jgi:hypothetical protein
MESEYIREYIELLCVEKDRYLSEDQKHQLTIDISECSDYLFNQLAGGFKGDRVTVECGEPSCNHFSRVWSVKKCNSCGKSFCKKHQSTNCPLCHHGRLY